MKYVVGILSALVIVAVLIFCPIKSDVNVEYLRIHIRANSNLECDQNVKYKVKDAVVEALIPVLSEVETFEQAKEILLQNFDLIENTADKVLSQNGFTYKSAAKLDNEYFPTRTYESVTLEEGYYDALILELGSGTGDNWWCIVFPAFCFTTTKNSDNVVYISRIWEIIQSVI